MRLPANEAELSHVIDTLFDAAIINDRAERSLRGTPMNEPNHLRVEFQHQFETVGAALTQALFTRSSEDWTAAKHRYDSWLYWFVHTAIEDVTPAERRPALHATHDASWDYEGSPWLHQ